MQLFIAVLTEGVSVPEVLQKFKDNNFHGSVLSTRSIRHALMDSVEPDPYFGGLSKIVDGVEVARPMIFVVVKKDEEVKTLMQLTNEALGGIKGKGFMYSVPISNLEGLED
ncbi:MAG: hypothetical protein MJ066_04425 [Clostridia bacterium]|nr:hypothetical protein [Clostridia bacterium]